MKIKIVLKNKTDKRVKFTFSDAFHNCQKVNAGLPEGIDVKMQYTTDRDHIIKKEQSVSLLINSIMYQPLGVYMHASKKMVCYQHDHITPPTGYEIKDKPVFVMWDGHTAFDITLKKGELIEIVAKLPAEMTVSSFK